MAAPEFRGFGLPVWPKRNATCDIVTCGLSQSGRESRRYIVVRIVTPPVDFGGILVKAAVVYVLQSAKSIVHFHIFLIGISKEKPPYPPSPMLGDPKSHSTTISTLDWGVGGLRAVGYHWVGG